MTYDKLDKANFLKKKIEQINFFLKSYKQNNKIEIKSVPTNNTIYCDCDKLDFLVEEKHHQEVIDMVTKWLNDYRKEFRAL